MQRLASFAAIWFLSTLPAPSHAAPIMSIAPVDNSGALTGSVTQDLMLEADSDWLNSQMLLTLSSGSVYQDTNGNDNPPNPNFFAVAPSLEFDTFLTRGHNTFGADPSVVGGAVDLGGDAAARIDGGGIDVAWYTNQTDLPRTGSLMLARITLSDDARGGWTVRTLTADGQAVLTGVVSGGSMAVPEPGSLALIMGCAAALALRARRRGGKP